MANRSVVFVQHLPAQADESTLRNAFGIFGDIKEVKIDKEKSTALVDFCEECDADAAIDNMNLSELFGETIYATHASKGNVIDKRKAVWKDEATNE